MLSLATVALRQGASGPFLRIVPPGAETAADDTADESALPFRLEDGTLAIERNVHLKGRNGTHRPAAGDSVRARAILQPSDATGLLHTDVSTIGDLAIADLAIAELLAVPGEQWSNPQLSPEFQDRYKDRLDSERGRISSGRTETPPRVARSLIV